MTDVHLLHAERKNPYSQSMLVSQQLKFNSASSSDEYPRVGKSNSYGPISYNRGNPRFTFAPYSRDQETSFRLFNQARYAPRLMPATSGSFPIILGHNKQIW
ncbi:hypothetical protein CHS0354_014907 [Potamilus streckersoni]|uniref:Uncharacterized protein n=1 Tax=Potamilus streckersoni TaxID=2493646 RepID=A0AAE0SSM6_9BIVA|nr:hypothetical protein CHS0354_014907 [Potamilus streckersoni]